MSKMDAMRAMREARFGAAAARPAGRTGPAATPAPKKAARPATKPARAESAKGEAVPSSAAGERLCGHRAISGRTCTREHGHEAKSHRYS